MLWDSCPRCFFRENMNDYFVSESVFLPWGEVEASLGGLPFLLLRVYMKQSVGKISLNLLQNKKSKVV